MINTLTSTQSTFTGVPYDIFSCIAHFLDQSSLISLKHVSYMVQTFLKKYCLQNNYMFDTSIILHVMTKSGNLTLTQWLRSLLEKDDRWTTTTQILCYENAARFGHLPLLQWTHKNDNLVFTLENIDKTITQSKFPLVCEKASEGGYVHILEWIHDNITDYKLTVECVYWAAQNGHLNVLQWLRNHNQELSIKACDLAAENGHLEIVIWFVENDCHPDSNNFCEIAYNGHLHVLKWLYEKNYDIVEDVGSSAASGGHLHILKWLREINYNFTFEICEDAAEEGHLHILKWLYEIGCLVDIDNMLCVRTLKYNHFETLQWLMENGYKGYDMICNIAAYHGCLDTLKWLYTKGYFLRNNTCYTIGPGTSLDVLEWLLEKGCIFHNELCRFALHDLNTLKWLGDHGCKWTVDCTIIIGHSERYHILECVMDMNNICDWPISEHKRIAKENNLNKFYKWLEEKEKC